MTNVDLLKDKIAAMGVTITFLAREMGISREGLYNKINGDTEFKGSEIAMLARLLHMSLEEREQIFFA